VSTSWQKLVSGEDCPFDEPRTNIEKQMYRVREMSVSTLFLDKNQAYRGHCILVFDPRHVVRIDQLTGSEWGLLAEDLRAAEIAINTVFRPEHMNVESLGNIVPHLHWHIIPRYIDDPRWGKPIWTEPQNEMIQVKLDNDEYLSLINTINQSIDQPEA
jgi:diadenosine tetraphosphate (Ap4A) HIT family hydrolase